MLLAADVVGLTAAFFLPVLFFGTHVTRARPSLELLLFVAAIPVWVVAAKLSGLYDHDEERADHSTADELAGVLRILTFGVWSIQLAAVAVGATHPQLSHLALFWVLAIGFVTTSRAAARAVCRRSAMYVQNTVVVGSDEVAQLVARKINQHGEYGMKLLGYVDASAAMDAPRAQSLPLLGKPDELARLVRELKIERVIIAFPNRPPEEMLALIRSMNDLNVQIDIVPRFFELVGPGAAIHAVEGLPLVGLPAFNLSRSSQLLKRAMDVVIGSAALLALTPLFVLIGIAIKLDSRGPVFFRQVRMGARERPFRIHKFRTMTVDADERKHEIAHLNLYSHTGDERMFKVADDPRVTRVGGFLRRFSLDELAQLIDVVLGKMSLVGPRPLILNEDQHVVDWARRRLDLKPGMTGLWQVLGRNSIPFDEMTKLDYLYVANWSPWNDIRLMLLTVPVLVRRREAY
jgi:exopolysaccharide biosynthesis polyprenyl glycosylphosphotransferase